MFDPAETRFSLFAALLRAAGRHGRRRPILEDPERAPLSYNRLILGAFVLGAEIVRGTRRDETIGVLLPNVNAAVLTLFGAAAYGRPVALLNFTAGPANLRSALDTARIRMVVTSRRFVEMSRLDDTVAAIAATPTPEGGTVRVVYLEELRQGITSLGKIVGVLRSTFASLVHRLHAPAPDAPAVILFTSGSEGKPKGVALSAANIIANVRQIEAHFGSPPLGPQQVILNPLPIFHSYGLTGGLMLGLLGGMRVVLYPSPLHYKQVPKLAKATGTTILFGTDTFLQGWAKAAEPDDLAGVKVVVAGAERIREQTRALYGAGTTILEGYGATECSPVIAVNQTFDNRPGTVGRILPAIEHRLDPVEGLEEGGRLSVRGPNVMAGYLLADRPGVLAPPEGGWHDTGDIVTVDADGFVRIKGRAKRFAKIGGEMVSLAAVETLASGLWPEATHVAVTLPDPRKGEQIVLVTDGVGADRAALLAFAQAQGYPELWVPKAILVTAAIPVMGSGKVDFVATQELARTMRPLL